MNTKEYYINIYMKNLALGLMQFPESNKIFKTLKAIEKINNVVQIDDMFNLYPELNSFILKNGILHNVDYQLAIISLYSATQRKVNAKDWQLGYYLSKGENAYQSYLNDLDFITNNKKWLKYLYFDIRKANEEFTEILK